MTLLLLTYLHVLAFVYWLGGDLGTYIASNQVINRENSPDARSVALKIMLACDMGPKLAMPLIFILGAQLGQMSGFISLSSWALILLWGLTALWFMNVAILYFKEGTEFAHRLARFDFWFRTCVVIGLITWVVWGMTNQAFAGQWFGWKVLIFAGMVFCGIMIRLNLKPFIPAFVKMMSEGASQATDDAMHASVLKCRPWVWLIWIGLFVNAALGLHLIG